MPTVTTHAPGTFVWPELATSDQSAAKKFYTGLFNWQFKDTDMGPDGVYTIFTREGKDAAALYTLNADMKKMGVPPSWASYISVEDADATAKKAKTLGGTVLKDAFDVMDHGRMAVITDPQGATFCVWQAKKNIGVGVLSEANSLHWTQLNTKDAAKAKQFYTGLIGWKTQDNPMPGGGGTYTILLKSDGPAGGLMEMPKNSPGPSHWLPYFAVADVDKTHQKATSLGGKTFVPPQDIPGTGRFAVLADPQGAVFAVMTAIKQ